MLDDAPKSNSGGKDRRAVAVDSQFTTLNN